MHRVGRTGRAGQAGTAVTLFSPQDAELEAELTQQLGGVGQPSSAAEEGIFPTWVFWFGSYSKRKDMQCCSVSGDEEGKCAVGIKKLLAKLRRGSL